MGAERLDTIFIDECEGSCRILRLPSLTPTTAAGAEGGEDICRGGEDMRCGGDGGCR